MDGKSLAIADEPTFAKMLSRQRCVGTSLSFITQQRPILLCVIGAKVLVPSMFGTFCDGLEVTKAQLEAGHLNVRFVPESFIDRYLWATFALFPHR